MPRQLVDITSPMLQAFADAYDRGIRNKQLQFDNEQKTKAMQQRDLQIKEDMRQFDETIKLRKEEEARRKKAEDAAAEHQKFLRDIAVREAIKTGTVRPNQVQQPEVFENINQLAQGNASVPMTPIVDKVSVLGQEIPRAELPEETTEQYKSRMMGLENEADLDRATIAAQGRMSVAQMNQLAQDERLKQQFEHQKELESIKQRNRLTLKSTPGATAGPGSMEYETRKNYLTPFITGSQSMSAKERQAYAKDLAEWQWVDSDGNIEARGAVPISPDATKRLKSYSPAVTLIQTLKEFEDAVKSRKMDAILVASSKLDGQLATMRELMGQQAYGVLNIPEVARLRGNLPQKWETVSDFVKGSHYIKQRREALARQYMKQLDSELAVTPHDAQKRHLMQQYNLWLPKELQPNGR